MLGTKFFGDSFRCLTDYLQLPHNSILPVAGRHKGILSDRYVRFNLGDGIQDVAQIDLISFQRTIASFRTSSRM
jgi:hypothetical protein